jgi:hypothetical protein
MKIRKNELTILEMVCASPSDIDNLVQKFPRDDFPVVFMNYHVDIRKTGDGLIVVIPEECLSDEDVSQLVKVLSTEYRTIKRKSRTEINVRLSRGVKKQVISGNLPLTIIPPAFVINRAKDGEVIQLEVKGN